MHGFNFNLSRSHSLLLPWHPWHYCSIIHSPTMLLPSLWTVTSLVDKSLEWRMAGDWVSGLITHFTVYLGFRCYWISIRKFSTSYKVFFAASKCIHTFLSQYNSYHVSLVLSVLVSLKPTAVYLLYSLSMYIQFSYNNNYGVTQSKLI